MTEPLIVTKVPMSNCSQCGAELNAATTDESNDFEPPKSGDFSVCIQCGCIHRYETDLRLRAATTRDLEYLEKIQPESVEQLRSMSSRAQAMNPRGIC